MKKITQFVESIDSEWIFSMPKLTWGRIIDGMDHALDCLLFPE